MRARISMFLVLAALVSLSSLVACGKRGDLYLPESATER